MSYGAEIAKGLTAPSLQVCDERMLGVAPIEGGVLHGRELLVGTSVIRLNMSDEYTGNDRQNVGVLHGVEVPEDPAKPVMVHLVEGALTHGELTRRVGLPAYYNGVPVAFATGRSQTTNMGMAFHANPYKDAVGIYTFFHETSPDQSVAALEGGLMPTALAVTTALARVLGVEIYRRLSGELAATVPLEVRCSVPELPSAQQKTTRDQLSVFVMRQDDI